MDVAAFRFSILLIAMLAIGICKKPSSRFTNLKCESYDLDFARFNTCRLNVVGRGIVGLNLYIELIKLPIDNVQVNWSMWRRYSGYKPFLYNASCDFCQLLLHPYSLTFQSLVLAAIRTKANLNYTCPIRQNIIINDLIFSNEFLKTLPLPQGDYKVQLRFATNKIWKFQIEAFLQFEE